MTFLPIHRQPSTDSNCRRQRASAEQVGVAMSLCGASVEPENPRIGQLLAGNSADTGHRVTRRVISAEGTAEFARRCLGVADGWTNAAGRPRQPFTRPRSRMPLPEPEVSA